MRCGKRYGYAVVETQGNTLELILTAQAQLQSAGVTTLFADAQLPAALQQVALPPGITLIDPEVLLKLLP